MSLTNRVEELEAEVVFLKGELAKARRYAKMISSLGVEEEGVEGIHHNEVSDSPRSSRGVSFDKEVQSTEKPRAKHAGRSSIAVMKNDVTQWEMYVEPTTGDPYWFNKALKVTVWEKPEVLIAQEQEQEQREEEGSIEHVVVEKPKHARLRSSSFVVRERAEEEHDESKWEERADEDGTQMWYHKTLKTSTYKMPAVISGRNSPVVAPQGHGHRHGHSHHEQGVGKDEHSASALSESGSEAESEWAQFQSKRGEPYWQHKDTREIVWSSPYDEDGLHDAHEYDARGYDASGYDAPGYDATGYDGGHHRQSRHPHHRLHHVGDFDQDEESKPSNWKTMLDKSSGDHYYVYLPTKNTQWECPACLL